jgi:hypothetical protein
MSGFCQIPWPADRLGPCPANGCLAPNVGAVCAAVRLRTRLYSTWDNQFYPELRSWLLRVNCDPNGGMEIDRDFFVDFHDRPDGPARAHEVRLQNGDCTTEIFQ